MVTGLTLTALLTFLSIFLSEPSQVPRRTPEWARGCNFFASMKKTWTQPANYIPLWPFLPSSVLCQSPRTLRLPGRLHRYIQTHTSILFASLTTCSPAIDPTFQTCNKKAFLMWWCCRESFVICSSLWLSRNRANQIPYHLHSRRSTCPFSVAYRRCVKRVPDCTE